MNEDYVLPRNKIITESTEIAIFDHTTVI